MKRDEHSVDAINDAARGVESSTDTTASARQLKLRRKRLITASIIVFLLAFGVRLLSLHDTRREVGRIQSVVVNDYKHVARLLLDGGVASFFSRSSPLANLNTLGHPPGYSLLLAAIYGTFGESDTATQLIQITFDALAAVLILLIVAEAFPVGAALIAGLLVAFSPQFAWNSVLLLPDSLAVFPVLLAVFCLARARKKKSPRIALLLAAGALAGLSCWLRANAMLLAPFLALAAFFLFERGRRLRASAALLAGAILTIAPLTIRNAVVFGYFIPVSLGAGQTLLEGIADYDETGRFGIPRTDMGIMKWEAERYHRPDYFGTFFHPDGVERERMRLRHGLGVIRSDPVWFLGVVIRRGASMLRLERARLIAASPPVTHSLHPTNETEPVWSTSPQKLLAESSLAPEARATLSTDNQKLQITGDASKYGVQLVSAPFEVEADTDYALTVPVKIMRGRMSISVKSAGTLYASTIVETQEMTAPEAQPAGLVQLLFVSGNRESLQVLISNAASSEPNPLIEVGEMKLFALGPAAYLWTRYPRALVRAVQKLYITAFMLPLSLAGLALLARGGRWRTLLILLVVPAYYVCVQSAVHTEYRYVLAIHYFLFAMAAVFIHALGDLLQQRLRKAVHLRARSSMNKMNDGN